MGDRDDPVLITQISKVGGPELRCNLLIALTAATVVPTERSVRRNACRVWPSDNDE